MSDEKTLVGPFGLVDASVAMGQSPTFQELGRSGNSDLAAARRRHLPTSVTFLLGAIVGASAAALSLLGALLFEGVIGHQRLAETPMLDMQGPDLGPNLDSPGQNQRTLPSAPSHPAPPAGGTLPGDPPQRSQGPY